MLATIFLLVTGFAGFAVATRAVPQAPVIIRAPAGFFLALIFTSGITYLIADHLEGHTGQPLRIGIIISTLIGALIAWRSGRKLQREHFRVPGIDAAVSLFALTLAWWLFDHRLREQNGELTVAANAWGDGALHFALSRSFAVGDNYPTQYPFFGGEPIHYHFGFDFFAGMLQKGGWTLLGAFNLPGALAFATIMIATFATARMLFGGKEPVRWFRDKGVWIGIVGVALVTTNQSLGWLRYVSHDGHGDILKALSPSVWWHHKEYLAAGPYTNDRIGLFNTLNPYLAQTHLDVAIAIVLLLSYVVVWQLRDGDRLNKKLLFGAGVTFGAMFWLNGVVWIGGAVYFAGLFAAWAAPACWRAYRSVPKDAHPDELWGTIGGAAFTWIKIGACFFVPSLLLGVPQAKILSDGGASLHVHLGWLVCASTHASCNPGQMNPVSLADWWSFIQYWWMNQGVAIPLLIVAFILGTWRDRKIIAAITCIFLWGSVFSVGTDIGGFNHKVFNLWETMSDLFVAFALVEIWIIGGRLLKRGTGAWRALGIGTRVATGVLAFFLVITGMIDFMTVKNDFMVGVWGDEAQHETTDWIVRNTDGHAMFLQDFDQMFTSPTMAGRRVTLGYSPWADSSGYKIDPRKKLVTDIYQAPDKDTACRLLKDNGITYVLIGPLERGSPRFKINKAVFDPWTPVTTIGMGDAQHKIYEVAANC